MVHFSLNWQTKTRQVARALSVAAWPLVILGGSVADAQSIMRTPSLHIDSRVTTINPTVTPRVNPTVGTRVNPNIAGRASISVDRPSVTVNTIARTPGPRVGVTTSVVRTSIPRTGV